MCVRVCLFGLFAWCAQNIKTIAEETNDQLASFNKIMDQVARSPARCAWRASDRPARARARLAQIVDERRALDALLTRLEADLLSI